MFGNYVYTSPPISIFDFFKKRLSTSAGFTIVKRIFSFYTLIPGRKKYNIFNHLIFSYESDEDFDLALEQNEPLFFINNMYFQLALRLSAREGGNMQFAIHMSTETHRFFLETNSIQNYGENDDEEFDGGGAFSVDVYEHYSVIDESYLTLKMKCYMSLFLELYLNHDVNVLLDSMVAKCHLIVDFGILSMHFHNEQFAYSSKYFGGRMNEVNCIMMTFIALSEASFSKYFSGYVDGGVLSIIFFFFQYF